MAVFGKWHLGGPGNDVQHVINMRVPNFRGFLGAQVGEYYNWTAYDSTGASSTVTTYTTTALTNWGIDFLKKHDAERPQDPWFLYMPYNAAHAPKMMKPVRSSEIVADSFPVSSEMTIAQPRPLCPPCKIFFPSLRLMH